MRRRVDAGGTFGDGETCLCEISVALMQQAQPLLGFQLEEESLTTKSHLHLKNDAWPANGSVSIKLLTPAREIKHRAKALVFKRVSFP